MINGDTLTTLNYSDLIDYHKRNGAMATISLKKRESYIDFGIVELDKSDTLTGYIEKPTINHTVSMGVYVFEPRVMEYIRVGEGLDLPDLIKSLISQGEVVKGFNFDGYWLDIGRPDDYAQAVQDFESMRSEFLLEQANAMEDSSR